MIKNKTDRINVLNIPFFNKLGLKNDYKTFKKIIETSNKEICLEILKSNVGFELPFGIGKLVIQKGQPRVKNLYTVTNKEQVAKEIFNLHSFGFIYKFTMVDKVSLKHKSLWKFRANREFLKKPLYHIIHSGLANYDSTPTYAV